MQTNEDRTVYGFTFRAAHFRLQPDQRPWSAEDITRLVAEAYADGWRAGAHAAANAATTEASRRASDPA